MRKGIDNMKNHQPYTQEEHWKAFWRMFYKQQKEKKLIEIPITNEMRDRSKQFSQKIIQVKLKERVHQQDSNYEWKRWMTGTLGEIVLETFLGASFRDVSIGESKHYAIPDLASIDLRIGVKSFQVGNFPLVNRSKKDLFGNRKNMDGQIFIGITQNLTRAYLFGVAFDPQLHHNESNLNNNRFVKDVNALQRKVAFTELDSLFSFHTLSDLQVLAKQHNCLIGKESRKIS